MCAGCAVALEVFPLAEAASDSDASSSDAEPESTLVRGLSDSSKLMTCICSIIKLQSAPACEKLQKSEDRGTYRRSGRQGGRQRLGREARVRVRAGRGGGELDLDGRGGGLGRGHHGGAEEQAQGLCPGHRRRRGRHPCYRAMVCSRVQRSVSTARGYEFVRRRGRCDGQQNRKCEAEAGTYTVKAQARAEPANSKQGSQHSTGWDSGSDVTTPARVSAICTRVTIHDLRVIVNHALTPEPDVRPGRRHRDIVLEPAYM